MISYLLLGFEIGYILIYFNFVHSLQACGILFFLDLYVLHLVRCIVSNIFLDLDNILSFVQEVFNSCDMSPI